MSVKIIGIMTGNSLDAVDAVLTDFSEDGGIRDICAHSLPYPSELRQRLLELRSVLQKQDYDIARLPEAYLRPLVDDYTALVAQTVAELRQKSGIAADEIAALGFHGQTCGHFPPSVAGKNPAYTLQIGNPRLLADAVGIPVIYDFRSDDIMNGGEGAPLAPMHNLHIAARLLRDGRQSVAFCNGGNTGNIAVVSAADAVCGWDIGPFNHLADKLMREYKNLPCDKDGAWGRRGQICETLLRHYFNTAARNDAGANFYLQTPPKSSDPAWYILDYDQAFSFADNLRTAEYLSAYSFVYNLSYLPESMPLPELFLLFGGGWKNPLIKADFSALLRGEGVILPEHQDIFAKIMRRLPPQTEVAPADKYGCSGEYMEARIFADMAWCKITNRPFSRPEITNCQMPTVGGVYVLPSKPGDYLLTRLLARCRNPSLPEAKPRLWSRAAKGWQKSA